jgi:mono/diheme cytochrome c family protein
MYHTRTIVAVALATVALATAVDFVGPAAQHQHRDAKKTAEPRAGSRRVTMDELHRGGGVPGGWKFTLPGGDATRGRQLFADLECFKCHVIKDAGFPPGGGDGNTGPELTGMGAHHPAEYFAESILMPNAVLLEGPGWIGPDGQSIMPSYADALTVTQLLDLVAFIKSQDGGGHAGHHAHGAVQERTVGPYRVRLMFHAAETQASGHGAHGAHGGHGGHAHHAPKAGGTSGHLMAFVVDASSGEPVPYLPVSAGVHVRGAPARVVKLAPMLGQSGFHYGADATLPSGTQRIVLTIGATTMRVMGADRARYARPQTVAFDWGAPPK